MFTGLISCKINENSERLIFDQSEQNGTVRLQSFVQGTLTPEKNIQNYEFTINQSENVLGNVQVDSTDPDLKVELIKKGFLFDSKKECTNTNLGNTYSCKIENQSLEKGRYTTAVYKNTNTKKSDFNLFIGIFGKGYINVKATSNY
ncbi:hypothetical protein LEP1GSC127_4223 [Leptospira kirschneri str. 200801925]|uniref:Lipoprotein n=1 Tax=Leptospira kirschneri str. 200802841 TaxID=1193047 RepID=A0A828Y744_9LEPT|nr:hypothetical protein [Leptospira kirschneri]EKO53871.1 hypothetical protein LEP1GSC131_4473 [Leptospira kirschneri str. 200802841]EMO76758.1 hypothetical protein LEP1GSC127_4223 [Leptospira kirschneri str. 200801925]